MGKLCTSVSTGADYICSGANLAKGIAISKDGRYLVGGQAKTPEGVTSFALIRVLP